MALYFSKKSHVFSYVRYAHASAMARARILLIRPRTTRVFRIFVTPAQLIKQPGQRQRISKTTALHVHHAF